MRKLMSAVLLMIALIVVGTTAAFAADDAKPQYWYSDCCYRDCQPVKCPYTCTYCYSAKAPCGFSDCAFYADEGCDCFCTKPCCCPVCCCVCVCCCCHPCCCAPCCPPGC